MIIPKAIEKRSQTIVTFAALIQAASSLPADPSALESSISALERQIATLESSSLPWERFLPWLAGLVVVGVLFELLVIRHERREDMAAWVRGTIRSPDKPSNIKLVVEIVSVVFIAIGIFGELGVGLKIASINGRLRTMNAELRSKSDQLIALVTQEAGDAKNSAQVAQGAAGSAKHLATGARREADSFEHDIALAKKQAEDTAKQLAPRTLNPSDWEAIGDKLIPFSSRFAGRKVTLSSYALDAEGIVFSVEISKIFERAGIRFVPHIGGVLASGVVEMGVHLTGPIRDKDVIALLGREIHEHADTDVLAEWNDKYSDLTVEVGIKPIAGLPRVVQPQ